MVGLGYSEVGVSNNNPSPGTQLIIGDLYQSINGLLSEGRTFDIVNLDNVLEHVVNPKKLMDNVAKLLNDVGIVIIKVPNDFSFLQQYFWNHDIIKTAHWIAPLDHISYFNKEGLINLCKSAGLCCIDFLSDQLIEFSALNANANYYENKDTGKSCHSARVLQENIFHSISPYNTIELFRVLGNMGVGREIIGVFKKGCTIIK